MRKNEKRLFDDLVGHLFKMMVGKLSTVEGILDIQMYPLRKVNQHLNACLVLYRYFRGQSLQVI